MTVADRPSARTPKDYGSDQEVRWCPGCGDYAILKGLQKTLAELAVRREDTVFISGIGCAARFPYYMSTYGFHTIHGRAPAIATGVKLANPELDVWVITGDGDGLSIGGNHTLHLLRRNVDLQILLFNNRVYGLTKGQYSPTSPRGQRTPSTPMGSLDNPVSPTRFALGSGGRFVARTVDTNMSHLVDTLKRAHAHTGTSFVEVFQNCVVFNKDAFAAFTDRQVAPDMQLLARHGEPLLFGADRSRGFRLRPDTAALEVVTVGEDGIAEDDVLVHDETNWALASLLASLSPPAFPMALGVLYCDPAPSYETEVARQIEEAKAQHRTGNLASLLRTGRTWTVAG